MRQVAVNPLPRKYRRARYDSADQAAQPDWRQRRMLAKGRTMKGYLLNVAAVVAVVAVVAVIGIFALLVWPH
jgi:hypothetical protein